MHTYMTKCGIEPTKSNYVYCAKIDLCLLYQNRHIARCLSIIGEDGYRPLVHRIFR